VIKLQIELIPKKAWNNNVRSCVTRPEWDIIRKKCYTLANHKCEICGDTGKNQGYKYNVECHEIWYFDDKNKSQKLIGFIALCPYCHITKHAGLAEKQGKWHIVVQQLKKVNNMTNLEVEQYISESFVLWEKRLKKVYRVNIKYYKQYMKSENEAFIKKMEGTFKAILHKEESKQVILIKNKNTGEVLNNIDYSKIMFDSYLNIYKKDKDGVWVAADSSKGFEAFYK